MKSESYVTLCILWCEWQKRLIICNETDMKKAILYCRVSSDEQAKGCSLDHQESELRQWCQRNNIEVEAVFREDYSAKTMNRPVLKKIVAQYCKKNSGVDYFLVLRWNRFSRNILDGYELIAKMKKYDIEVNAIEEWKGDSAEAKILQSVFMSMAEVDNDKRAKATCDGIHATLLKGKWPNKAPRGYVNKKTDDYNKWVEIDPKVGPLVQEAFNEVAKGVLVPTLVWREMKKKGLECEKQSFFDMLRNRFYIGEVFVPAYNNDPDQYVKGQHEPLVSPDVFYKVQEILNPALKRKRDNESKSKQQAKITKYPKPELYLHDFLTCPVCGHRLCASFSSGRHARYPYYHCNECHKYRTKADVLNRQLETSLNTLTPSDNIIRAFAEICDEATGESKREYSQRIGKLKEDIKEKEEKLLKLQDMFMDEKLSPENFSAMTDRYNREIALMKSELNDLQNIPSDKAVFDKLVAASNIINHLGDILAQLPVNEKIELLGSIISENLVLSEKNYRTAYLKPALAVIAGISDNCEDKKRADCDFFFTARLGTQSRGRTGTGCPTGV